jgi:ABC-type branched-subunit amino acid transport system substrate-binding protein
LFAGNGSIPKQEENMKNRMISTVFCFVALAGFAFSPSVLAAPPAKILIGEPATLSGKYAKAGEQAAGGIEAIVDWVNNTYGGVKLGEKKVPLEYKKYDCESKKEAVTSSNTSCRRSVPPPTITGGPST